MASLERGWGALHRHSPSEHNLTFGGRILRMPLPPPRGRRGVCLQTLLCFFFQCLKQYVELLIKEGLETAISCPDAACPKQGQLQDSEARAGATGFGGCAAGRRACRGVAGPVPADLRDVPALGLSYSSFVFLSP